MAVLSRGRAAADTGGRWLELARCGARGAATWAAPRVNGARAWAAPRIERSGLAIKDTIAPRISEVLVVTARRVDVAAPPRRRWPWVVAGTGVVVAAGAAAAAVLRRRADDGTGEAPGDAPGEGTSPAQDGQAPAGGSGAPQDIRRPSPPP